MRTAAAGHPLRAAGTKFLYDDGPWHVSLSLEPKAQVENQLVANVNFEVSEPTSETLADLLAESDRLYASLLATLDQLFEEAPVATAH